MRDAVSLDALSIYDLSEKRLTRVDLRIAQGICGESLIAVGISTV